MDRRPPTQTTPDGNALRGLRNAILPSLVIWAIIIGFGYTFFWWATS